MEERDQNDEPVFTVYADSPSSSITEYRCLMTGCSLKEKVNPLNNATIVKSREISSFRKTHLLKYKEVDIPSEIDETTGFHLNCYRKFVSLSKKQRDLLSNEINQNPSSTEQNQSNSDPKILLRSKLSAPCSSSGVFVKKCFICEKTDRKIKGTRQPLILSTKDLENPIKDIVLLLDDQKLITKLEVNKTEDTICDFVAKEIRYHPICRTELQNRANQKKSTKSETSWHLTRQTHNTAFDEIKGFVEEHVVLNDEAHFMKNLVENYCSLLIEIGGSSFKDVVFTSQHLQDKLQNSFGDIIRFGFGNKCQGNIVYNAKTNLDEAVRKAKMLEKDVTTKLRESALILRNAILSSNKTSLPHSVSLPDIFKGEIEIPDKLKDFLTYLIHGYDKKNCSLTKKRRIESTAQDIIYSATGGKTKPSKHLLLGLTLKSMTGSRRIIEIMNRLGHSINYNLVEELETELTYSSLVSERITPIGMSTHSNMSTGIAFDNFDRYVETLNGKDTLHDTVGICYQDIQLDNLDSLSNTTVTNNLNSVTKKRRRRFENYEKEIEPYYKKPKMRSSTLLPTDDERMNYIPSSFHKSNLLDTLWKMSLYFSPRDTPMWVGWNSKIQTGDDVSQKVFYLPQIDMSPTSNAVVVETLNIAKKIAQECNKEEMCVTYDLAIAKVALQIQAEESPTFDNLFIFLGQFHTEMAFFNAIGKYIAESGGPSILVSSNTIASGSLCGFLKGKHYNRCKRIHSLLAAAMEILHLKLFISKVDISLTQNIIENDLFRLMDDNSPIHNKSFNIDDLPKEIIDFVQTYGDFKEDTRSGLNGLTAQYWVSYIDMIDLYHNFSRSTRCGNLELYIYTLRMITNYFFIFNQPNYARWSVRIHDNILKIDETHPTLADEFRKGRFGVKRTSKNFSRMPIDLTLEQTINAEAANQRTGINSLTNSISARQRWAQSHFLRMSVVTRLLDNLDLNTKEDVTSDLKISKMKQNANSIATIVQHIEERINPFSSDLDKEYLVNIETGKVANTDTTTFLLSVASAGNDVRLKFIDEVNERSARFEEPIKRNKLLTFANEGKKVDGKTKVTQLKMERNLYGRLLCVAIKRSIDLSVLLKYPITPVPLSMGHVDGTIAATPKSKFANHLEKIATSINPTSIDVYIIDGMFFLRSVKYFPSTFESIADYIIKKLCNFKAKRIDLVFDRYQSPSVKDVERTHRGADQISQYKIISPLQERPNDMISALRSNEFKNSFIEFLYEEWQNEQYSGIISDKTLFVTSKERVVSLKNDERGFVVNTEYHLFSNHEEADYRLLLHISDVDEYANIVVRATDTDILVILLGNLHKFTNKHIWMEVGKANDLRFIDTLVIGNHLGTMLCKSLPGFHAFTGCDYSPAFVAKGKIRPFKILQKDSTYQAAFAQLGSRNLTPTLVSNIESFACKIYGNFKTDKIDEVLLHQFLHAFDVKKNSNWLNIVKGTDGSSFPPCHRVLYQHILRTEYISCLWKNNADELSPLDFGWTISDNKFDIKWFDGDQYPTNIADVTSVDTVDDEDDDDSLHYSADDDEEVSYGEDDIVGNENTIS